jgi:hypothetical protein
MTRVSVKGVLVGAVVDILATNIVMVPLLAVASVKLGFARLPKAEQAAAIMSALQPGSSYYIWALLLGSACSILGGYVAARIAKRHEVLNGALSAILCMAFGLYAFAKGTGGASPTTHVAFLALSPVLGALGGYLRARTGPGGDERGVAPAAAA